MEEGRTGSIWKSGETSFPLNWRNRVDGLTLLDAIDDGTIAAAFFDPQYRGVLDKLSYGNEGKQRGQARAALQQMDEGTIVAFIQEIDRVLRPQGHLFLWVDKYHLCQGTLPWLEGTDLNLVDMIVWDKGRIGMGYRTRRKSEYLVVLQKSPVRAKGVWVDHAIPDVWEERVAKTHAHSKPVELQRRLIAAVTQDGDIVLDPASGGYSVLEACRLLGRDFVGGDIRYGDESEEGDAAERDAE